MPIRKAEFQDKPDSGEYEVAARFHPNLDPQAADVASTDPIIQQLTIVVQAPPGFDVARMAELAQGAINELMDQAIIDPV